MTQLLAPARLNCFVDTASKPPTSAWESERGRTGPNGDTAVCRHLGGDRTGTQQFAVAGAAPTLEVATVYAGGKSVEMSRADDPPASRRRKRSDEARYRLVWDDCWSLSHAKRVAGRRQARIFDSHT